MDGDPLLSTSIDRQANALPGSGSGQVLGGLQFEYQYDGIGNRAFSKFGGDENGGDLRTMQYSVNSHNQYTSVNRTDSNPDHGAHYVVGYAGASRLIIMNMVRALIGVFLVSPLWGQENSPPAIVGEIRTSVGNTQPKSRVLLNRTIKSSKVIHDQGRTITVYKVEAPAPSVGKAPENIPVERLASEPQIEAKPSAGFTVSATVLSDNLTRLEWWSHSKGQTEKQVSWSNIGWQNLQGFNTIEDKERSYTFMLFLGGDSVEEFNKRAETLGLNTTPDFLPDFNESGSRYTNETEEEVSEVGNAFMEAIHTLYDSKAVELKQAQTLRQENREKHRQELADNPPKKEDVVIQFWKREPLEETPATESK